MPAAWPEGPPLFLKRFGAAGGSIYLEPQRPGLASAGLVKSWWCWCPWRERVPDWVSLQLRSSPPLHHNRESAPRTRAPSSTSFTLPH